MYQLKIIIALLFPLFFSNNFFSQTKQFEITFDESIATTKLTGRVFLIISKTNEVEPRLQKNETQIFGIDVEQISPDSQVIFNEKILGFPLESIKDIESGDYYVQAMFNLYTKFSRSDGHTIWAHMDQWEGQDFKISPGNFYSSVLKIHFNKSIDIIENLVLNKVIPQIEIPEDTEWIKRIKIKSEILTKFWGHPFYLGATILLPKGYYEHPEVEYPVHYIQSHFSLDPLYNFTTNNDEKENEGYEFYKTWISENFPRLICVLFQHPTPYYDDSYAVNSANNGPFGDAILSELIPEIESEFRIIRKPYARILSGGSTGGWEALALQVYHPDFFGGTWVFYPDPIDFSQYGLINLYEDENAFSVKLSDWRSADRPMKRTNIGQPKITYREVSRYESVLGSKRRSGEQLAIWEAVFGPVGNDGYPKPLWDACNGLIDKSVVEYMKNNNYDLKYYMVKNWNWLGPKLVGKLHFSCGDMDGWYLNLGTYKMEEFLENEKFPYYNGSFEYGRPLKGHGWREINDIELIKKLSNYILEITPKDELPAKWLY